MADHNPLLSLLRECVVRLDADGDFRGTGFFVAPGEVLTCAHVVHGAQGLTASGPGWSSAAEAVALAPELEQDDPRAAFYPFPDLALLRVGDAPASHPCVLIEGDDPVAGSAPDVLHLFGYSQGEYSAGKVAPSSAAVDYKGFLGDVEARLYKLGGDQVLRGYSGCPALNLRTGSVCAVIDSTRDVDSDLGGFGVPLAVLEELFPGLPERNAAHHRDTPEWGRAWEAEKVAAQEREGPSSLPLLAPFAELASDGNWPQSDLLKARYGVVGLVGREFLQEQLMRWRESDDRLGVVLMTGGGGFGKTRLALEECERARRAGWTAGLLALDPSESPDQTLRQLVEAPGRLFVAIDYAETRPALVGSLLLRLARRADGPPVRLILVCRQVHGRALGELFATGDGREEIERVLAAAEPVGLDRLELDGRRLFEAGVATFAARLRDRVPDIPRPSLRGPHFARPLFVLAAALLVAQDPTVDIDSLGQERLMLELLDRHETQYWERLNSDLGAGLDPVLQARAVAVAAVLGAETEQEALDLVGVVPGLEEASAERRRTVARWLSSLYGDGRLDRAPAISPIEPDMLAETLVGREYTSQTALLGATLDVASDGQLARALAVLTKAGESSEELAKMLRSALDARLPALVSRIAADGELEAALDLAVKSVEPKLGAARVMASAPDATQDSEALLASIGRLAVEHWREMPEDEDAANRLRGLASALNNLSIVLGHYRYRAEALGAIEEAVAHWRALSEDVPDSSKTELAMSLGNLASRLSSAGEDRDALPAAEEAVALWRAIAEREPDPYLAALASSLNSLSTTLEWVGEDEKALEAIEEAVAHWRTLVKLDPDRHLADLASSLNNLSTTLSSLGRPKEALEAIEEAVASYKISVEAAPEQGRHELAGALNNLSGVLSELGRNQPALEVIEEAVAHWRALVERDPDRHLGDLATSLNNLSNRLGDVGQIEMALVPVEEAVANYRALVSQNPSRHLADLATSLNNLSNRLDEIGRSEEALTAIEEAVAHRRRLAEANPARYLSSLAMSLNNLSTVLFNLSRPEEAMAASQEAVEHRRQLVAKDGARSLPSLASALNNHSVILTRGNREEEALGAIEESVAAYRTLVAENPDRYLPDLASAINNLANRLDDVGRSKEAVEACQEAVGHLRGLAAENPVRHLPELAGSLNNLSTVLSGDGRPEEAIEASEESVRIRRELVANTSIRYLPDLCKSLNNFSLLCSHLGRREKAREAIEAAIEAHPDPDPPLLMLVLAGWHAGAGETDDAIGVSAAVLERALEAGDAGARAAARQALTGLRALDEARFDAAWDRRVGGEMPGWLRHHQPQEPAVKLVLEWLHTPDWDTSRAFAEERPELLSDECEAVLEHLLDQRSNDPLIAQHLGILKAARSEGVAGPYDQIARAIATQKRTRLVGGWLAIEVRESQAFLDEHADEILDPQSEEDLLSFALSRPPSAEACIRLGLLSVARSLGSTEAYALLDGPPQPSTDAACLDPEELPLALGIARIGAGLDPENPDRLFHHALAALGAGNLEEARQASDRCRELVPSWELKDYVRRLEELALAHPESSQGLNELKSAFAESRGERSASESA